MKEKFEYFSKHIGAITWISAICVTIISVFIKFLWYTFERGTIAFWGISNKAVSVFNENIIYSMVLSVAFGAVVILINLIPFFILRSNSKILIKILKLLAVFSVFTLAVFIITKPFTIIQSNKFIALLATLIVAAVAFAIFFAPCFFLYFCQKVTFKEKDKKDEIKPTKKKAIKFVIWYISIYLVIATLYSYGAGYTQASNQNKFKVIEEQYVVVYETVDNYYIFKCNINSDEINIDKTNQKIVSKVETEYNMYTFKQVNISNQ